METTLSQDAKEVSRGRDRVKGGVGGWGWVGGWGGVQTMLCSFSLVRATCMLQVTHVKYPYPLATDNWRKKKMAGRDFLRVTLHAVQESSCTCKISPKAASHSNRGITEGNSWGVITSTQGRSGTHCPPGCKPQRETLLFRCKAEWLRMSAALVVLREKKKTQI